MVEYYSAFKRNEFESVELRWMKLESAIQSEVSQRKINIVYEYTYMYIGYRKIILINLFIGQE